MELKSDIKGDAINGGKQATSNTFLKQKYYSAYN